MTLGETDMKENCKMRNIMVMVNSLQTQVELMRETGQMANMMAMANLSMLMLRLIKENGRTDLNQGKEHLWAIIFNTAMMENGKMIDIKDMEFGLVKRMGIIMLVILTKEKRMAKVNLTIKKMENYMRENSWMMKNMAKVKRF